MMLWMTEASIPRLIGEPDKLSHFIEHPLIQLWAFPRHACGEFMATA
jgi:hypothetical protein